MLLYVGKGGRAAASLAKLLDEGKLARPGAASRPLLQHEIVAIVVGKVDGAETVVADSPKLTADRKKIADPLKAEKHRAKLRRKSDLADAPLPRRLPLPFP